MILGVMAEVFLLLGILLLYASVSVLTQAPSCYVNGVSILCNSTGSGLSGWGFSIPLLASFYLFVVSAVILLAMIVVSLRGRQTTTTRSGTAL